MQVHVKLNIKYDSKYFFFKLDLHLMKCLKEKKRIKIVATWFLTHIKYFDTFNICILYFFKKNITLRNQAGMLTEMGGFCFILFLLFLLHYKFFSTQGGNFI